MADLLPQIATAHNLVAVNFVLFEKQLIFWNNLRDPASLKERTEKHEYGYFCRTRQVEALSKQHIKFLRSLWQKKYRQKYGQFLVEGAKSVMELFHSSYKIERIYRIESSEAHSELSHTVDVVSCTRADMERISQLKTAPELIALANIPEVKSVNKDQGGWILGLDRINDPGNLGTIVRIADWFGIREIWCSPDTVDLYNYKTLMACMGSFTRVEVLYGDLATLLTESKRTKYFALLEGEDVRFVEQTSPGILVIGNEANGISDELMQIPHIAVSIRGYGGAESLNAAVSAGILCHTLIR